MICQGVRIGGLPIQRPFTDIVLRFPIVPTDQVRFFGPAFIGFGKHTDLFDDFKFDVCHGYFSGLFFSMMVSLHDRKISYRTPSRFWSTSVFEKCITPRPSI